MQQSPIYSKTYDFLKWLIPASTKLPREHRFGLTSRLQDTAFAFYETLFIAAENNQTHRVLVKADSLLKQLKSYWRLCFDLSLMPVKRYEHGSRLLDELGRLLGGWLKVVAI